MGKGDKKTKRGKIIIGSSGVSRSRKKKKNIAPVAPKAEPKANIEPEEVATPHAVTATKKAGKKPDEHVDGAEDKPKAAKTKKKAAEGETETAHEEPKQE
jgi:30S ribosomal protein S31